MSGELVRASDDDRERAIASLREHLVAGRLTLEEFTDRMTAVLAATTSSELEPTLRELPAPGTQTRRRPTRFVLGAFGSTERAGRLRLRRRALCLSLFGNVDFDLRRATLEGEVITIVAVAAFAALDVYVPEGVEVDLHGLTIFGHKNARGNDPPPWPGTPIVRVYAFAVFAGMDVWRVPAAWAKQTLREVIRGIEKGKHRGIEQ
jgi:hypothetical protein